MIAVKKIPNRYKYVGKSLKDGDDSFKIAFQQNEVIT